MGSQSQNGHLLKLQIYLTWGLLRQSDWFDGSPKLIENMLNNIMGKFYNREVTAAPSASRWDENCSIVLCSFENKVHLQYCEVACAMWWILFILNTLRF